MPQPSDYRKRAQECVELAQAVRSPQQRTMLLHIAETWLRLADDASVGPLFGNGMYSGAEKPTLN